MQYTEVPFETLVGKILTAVSVVGDSIQFRCVDGTRYILYHVQDCCESVVIEDITGNLADLVGSEIVVALVNTNVDEPRRAPGDESYTWTFYKLATIKGWVDIRWYGTSNGYYSEEVSFARAVATRLEDAWILTI